MKARMISFNILKEICIQKGYSNLVLQKKLELAQEKDKGFITQIVYGTLQNYRYCRYQWVDFVKKMDHEEIALLLDMSVYQCSWSHRAAAAARAWSPAPPETARPPRPDPPAGRPDPS